MARNSAISPESFEEILAWLDPDREVAAGMYVQLHHDLQKIFTWRRCADPEGLADEVIDRVMKKVKHVKPTYEGSPLLYFRAVANNVVREYLRTIPTQVSLEDVDLSKQQLIETETEDADIKECLQSCLQELSTEKRDLILGYYAQEKQAKINHRSELARQLGIRLETLRVRVYRIRLSLHECIERCLESREHRK